jgi:ADP-ribose pyrophosphatase YjhB (NUDIX family)
MEQKILEQFLYSDGLKFSEIEKSLKVRSNKLNYHLQNLMKKGVLEKKGERYSLSESSEYLIPYLSSKKHVLTVLLVHVGNSRKAFLIKRDKRPYKDLLSMPGGRLVLGESIEEGSERILKKFGVGGKFKKVNSVTLEHLKKNGKVLASYLLVYVSAGGKGLELVDLEENKRRIIESDYKLMTEDFGKRVKIGEIWSVV